MTAELDRRRWDKAGWANTADAALVGAREHYAAAYEQRKAGHDPGFRKHLETAKVYASVYRHARRRAGFLRRLYYAKDGVAHAVQARRRRRHAA